MKLLISEMKQLKDFKIFESLNCILCKEPFEPIARRPRSPRHLGCGLAMCHNCFEKEKSLKKKQRKHQCNYNDECFFNPNFAYFIIDVLSQDCFTLQPNLGGYLLKKPLIVPTCPICEDEYLTKVATMKAFVFYCNHIVCTECFDKMLEPNNDVRTQATWPSTIACPTCQQITYTENGIYLSGPWLRDFLNELPEMTRQLEGMKDSKFGFCEECEGLDILDEMFHCTECTSEICASCAFIKHRRHNVHRNLEKKADELFEKLREESTLVIKTYKDLLPELHKDLIDNINAFERKLLSQEETLKEAFTVIDLQDKNNLCTKLKTDFEAAAEKCLPHLRKFGTEIKGLVQTLDANVTVSKKIENVDFGEG